RTIYCKRCGEMPSKGTLFQLLLRLADSSKAGRCDNCSGQNEIRLKFNLGLDVTDNECTIEAAFRPRKPEWWTAKNGAKVTFYPFLVILKRGNRARAAWLPYW